MTQQPNQAPDGRLLYFSPVFWRSYPQRPHAFARYFLDHVGARVLWVNPYLSRLPLLRDFRTSLKLHDQRTELRPGLEVVTPFALPIEPLAGGTALNRVVFWQSLLKYMTEFSGGGRLWIGIGKPCDLAIEALRRVKHQTSFYDMMDNFPAFHQGLSRRAMMRAEETIVSEVNHLLVSSTFLEQRMAGRHQSVRKVLNACSFNDADQAPRDAAGPKRFGYLGSIASWFDWTLVRDLARLDPNVQIDLVGPVFVPPPEPMPKNVRIHGPCSQDKSRAYMTKWSLGLIPFSASELTAGVDPIKYYDYRSEGLPVLTTRFGEMACRGPDEGVFFAEPGADLGDAVTKALAWHDQDVITFRNENSWSKRLQAAGIFDPV